MEIENTAVLSIALFGWGSWHSSVCKEMCKLMRLLSTKQIKKPQTKQREAYIIWSLLIGSWSFRYASFSNAFENLVRIHYLNTGGLKGFPVPTPFSSPR